MGHSIIEQIRKNACYLGPRNAIVFGSHSITYEELERKTNCIAAFLQKKISKQQVPIIIYHTRGIKFVEYMIAILKCNCYYIPLEDVYPVERVERIYDDIGAEFVISDLLGKDSNMKVLNIEKELPQGSLSEKNIDYSEQDLAYVMYTSGTTGNPKGIAIKHENLENLIETFGEIIYKKFTDNINVGLIAPFSFDTSVKQIYCALFYAKTLVIADGTVRHFGRKIHHFHNENNLTICDATPSHIKLMLIQNARIISKLPYLFVGGENLRWEMLIQYREKINDSCCFVNLYGPTECCVDVSYHIITDIVNEKGRVPIGKAFKNTQLVLVDENENVVSQPNCVGELIVYGKQVGYGYVGKQDKGGYIYGEEGTIGYKTGDLAMYDENFDLVILSRKDRQIKVNGYRIELSEIERTISDCCHKQCIVCCFDTGKKSLIIAYIIKNKDEECDIDELSMELEKRLMPYMLPKEFLFLEEIPLNINGKTDEKKLWEIYRNYKNYSY